MTHEQPYGFKLGAFTCQNETTTFFALTKTTMGQARKPHHDYGKLSGSSVPTQYRSPVRKSSSVGTGLPEIALCRKRKKKIIQTKRSYDRIMKMNTSRLNASNKSRISLARHIRRDLRWNDSKTSSCLITNSTPIHGRMIIWSYGRVITRSFNHMISPVRTRKSNPP